MKHRYLITFKKPVTIAASNYQEAVEKAVAIAESRTRYLTDIEDLGEDKEIGVDAEAGL